MSRRILIFDTTLRDGEQSPGCSMNTYEKIRMARQLQRLRVDVIEAGFPIASEGDFQAVQAIAQEVREVTVAALSRAKREDIDRAWQAIREARKPRIHTFIATSPIHMQHKLRMTPREVLAAVDEAVRQAKSYTEDVEFSAEDASRSELEFLFEVVRTAIRAGATTINLPDTVGYATPGEYGAMFRAVRQHVPESRQVRLSAHTHDDLGMAVANALAAVENGADQVECTVNGIGERAGNAALEEVVMAIRTRRNVYDAETGVDTRQIVPTSRLLSSIIHVEVQPNKAIVGRNAFAHEAGIHQHGVLQHAMTYEIMSPEDIGLEGSRLVLGKHSGRHAIDARCRQMGMALRPSELDRVYRAVKRLADVRKEVRDEDLRAIVERVRSRKAEATQSQV